MAEFDTGGLSAVSAFFGVDKPTKDVEATTTTHSSHSTTRGRHGVGSTTIQQQQPKVHETLGRVLLKVGKRKRSDKEIDENVSDDSSHDEQEEEEGRTAIAERTSKAPIATSEPTLATKLKKKKKKGKKERQAEAETLQADEVDTTFHQQETEKTNKEEEQEDSNKSKRKRRKVRSRQKNIYKDKRLTQHKPGHLILGRAEFQGRPLTTETRAKLNLAPSRSSRQAHDSENANDVHVVEGSTHNEGIKLAVDDLLEDESEEQRNGDKVDPDDSNTKHRRNNQGKKRKKSKYKNLQ